MDNKVAVTYEQIEKANNETVKTDIKGKNYAQVSERVKAFRKVYPQGSIETCIEEIKDDYVRIYAVAKNENGIVIATGRASETKEQKSGMNVNLTSMIENCETSAVGRALGFAGFGIDNGIASEDEIKRAKVKQFEYAPGMFTVEDNAINVVKMAISDLIRKMGVIKVELNNKIKEKLWCESNDLNIQQLLNLERILKTLNSESNEWHDLYAQNSKIKDIVPKNTQVSYQSSWERFGQIAIKHARDETKRNEVIDFYLELGIDLSKVVSNEANSHN